MSELRWILIGFGIVLLAGIYLWGRRGGGEAAAADEGGPRTRPEPHIPTLDAHEDVDAMAAAPLSVVAEQLADSNETAAERRAQRDTKAAAAMEGDEDGYYDAPAHSRRRIEPTFDDDAAAPTAEPAPPLPRTESAEPAEAPTLALSSTPQPRRIERRKILILRLAAEGTPYEGARLVQMLQAEGLQHGKYQIFHRLHTDGASIFSVASIVEPGTFDPEKMAQSQHPGITLFAQLPGPLLGMHALNELVACSKRLHQTLGGTLQDERGVPLTVHRIERMRQEIRDFERPPGGGARSGVSVSQSANI
jgi:cell division protein ZipA